MMKKILTILSVFLVLSTNAKDSKQDYFKYIEKEFNSNSATLVDITNKYGDVVIKESTDDIVKIKVKIRVKVSSESRAQKTFDKIAISINKSENSIKALTALTSSISNVDFSIDYEIFMPKDLKLKLYNKYGGVFINELTNLVDIAVKYGSLKINNLTRGKEAEKNKIYVGYSSATIKNCNWTKIESAYSTMNVNNAFALIVLTKYSNWDIKRVNSLVMSSKYDQPINIDEVGNLVITEGKYADYNIENLNYYLEANIKYSNLEIDNVDENFEELKVNLRYGQFSAEMADEAQYKFSGEAEYGDLDVELTKVEHKIRENSYLKIEGYKGSSNAKANIHVSGRYSKIEIN